jgi:hypothetical protein
MPHRRQEWLNTHGVYNLRSRFIFIHIVSATPIHRPADFGQLGGSGRSRCDVARPPQAENRLGYGVRYPLAIASISSMAAAKVATKNGRKGMCGFMAAIRDVLSTNSQPNRCGTLS